MDIRVIQQIFFRVELAAGISTLFPAIVDERADCPPLVFLGVGISLEVVILINVRVDDLVFAGVPDEQGSCRMRCRLYEVILHESEIT